LGTPLENGLELDLQADSLRVRSLGCDRVEQIGIPIRKSVFRAILARVAAVCNERVPNSVSPYGGHGEVSVSANPAKVFNVEFINTPAEQRLRITTARQPAPASQ